MNLSNQEIKNRFVKKIDFNYSVYKTYPNGNIISYKNEPMDCVIEISDDECDVLPDDEYIDVVGFEADESMKDIEAQSSIYVQSDVIKPNKLASATQNSFKIKYGCTMCSTNFSTAKKLLTHLRSFMDSKKRDALTCNFCQIVLCSLRRLKEHVMGMHHGSRYKCNLCTKTYVNLTCYETHQIVAHSKYSRKYLSESSVSSQESRSISPATFSSLLAQSASSSPPTLPIPIQNWASNYNQSNARVNSTKNKLLCRQHPEISHCICRLI